MIWFNEGKYLFLFHRWITQCFDVQRVLRRSHGANVIPIMWVTAIRLRTGLCEDLHSLVTHFLWIYTAELGRQVCSWNTCFVIHVYSSLVKYGTRVSLPALPILQTQVLPYIFPKPNLLLMSDSTFKLSSPAFHSVGAFFTIREAT